MECGWASANILWSLKTGYAAWQPWIFVIPINARPVSSVSSTNSLWWQCSYPDSSDQSVSSSLIQALLRDGEVPRFHCGRRFDCPFRGKKVLNFQIWVDVSFLALTCFYKDSISTGSRVEPQGLSRRGLRPATYILFIHAAGLGILHHTRTTPSRSYNIMRMPRSRIFTTKLLV